MSRQRLRTGVLEGSTSQCPHCQGTGIIRSTESVALAVLRGLEDAIMAGTRAPLIATTTPSVALYILNNKRPFINDMEARVGLPIMVTGSDKLAGANFTIEKGAAPAQPQRRIERNVVNMESGFEGEDEGGEYEAREQPSSGRESYAHGDREERGGEEEGGSRRRRRRRRGRRGDRGDREHDGGYAAEARASPADFGEDQASEAHHQDADGESEHGDEGAQEAVHAPRGEEGGEGTRERGGRSRRRGRRGGRRGRERNGHGDRSPDTHARNGSPEPYAADEPQPSDFLPAEGEDVQPPAPAERPRQQRSRTPQPFAAHADSQPTAAQVHQPRAEPTPALEVPAPVDEAPAPRRRTGSSEPRLERIVVGPANGESATEGASPSAPARKGWWQRKLGGE
jgi:ribonuclease E